MVQRRRKLGKIKIQDEENIKYGFLIVDMMAVSEDKNYLETKNLIIIFPSHPSMSYHSQQLKSLKCAAHRTPLIPSILSFVFYPKAMDNENFFQQEKRNFFLPFR